MYIKHGDYLTRLYGLWCNFRYRCRCLTSKDYKYYGARGISVCKKWEDYKVFKEWAQKNGYKEGLTIDRINNNGNYTPNNCRFVTIAVNNGNKRRPITAKDWFIDGKKYKTMAAAAKKIGVDTATIHHWCCGYKRYGKIFPPKIGCYAEKVY